MRIGIDAMGGDHAPVEEVRGALAARELLAPGDRVVLVGQEDAIRAQLKTEGVADWDQWVDVRHASQFITMNEHPVTSLRAKPDSSLAVMTKMHRDGELQACISAGNTGAFVAAAQMNLRRLPGVHRPGIAVIVPTSHNPVAVCDVGANIQCRPLHLLQYGIMASIYMDAICSVKNARVGLLSVGEEDAKGNELVKATRQLMKADRGVNFIGNVEGRDVFRGTVDVVVCEGFVGNVVLKLIEGMAAGVIKSVLKEIAMVMPDHLDKIKAAGAGLAKKFDFNEYGGAPLLGVAGICIICHGASDFRAIKNAVRVAGDFSRRQVNEQITELCKSTEEA
ncbi:MAG: phosphate acyltransferase PlsX [Planctomycetaceae bacterium]|nr:phosphate acyltransferase PlsX [Planctomycetaceae bacterium]